MLTITLGCTKPDDNEEYPEFYQREDLITIDDGTVHLKMKSISTNMQEAEYQPLSWEDIPADITQRVSDQAILPYPRYQTKQYLSLLI